MQPREFLDILTVAERLKDATRHCYTTNGRHESVAEHCWMACLMAFMMKEEFPEYKRMARQEQEYAFS